ncbi:MAG TPA: hypothetical protein VE987_19255, partial [Polyangiaceae bacterium]|nr:hypothetical protein [Polyangiaceae bacterium]
MTATSRLLHSLSRPSAPRTRRRLCWPAVALLVMGAVVPSCLGGDAGTPTGPGSGDTPDNGHVS